MQLMMRRRLWQVRGEIRGVQIEAALVRIRGVINDPYSDQQLATAILML
ncbi:DUF2388 domain-containing protein [Pseudomonas sp. LB3P25]